MIEAKMDEIPKMSLYEKCVIGFSSLFAEIIRKSFCSIIPFVCFEIYEIIQNIVFVSWGCSEGGGDTLNFYLSLFLFVGDIYMKNITKVLSIVAMIITFLYILYIFYIFLIIFRNIKEKYKLTKYNIVICQIAFLAYEKVLLIPIIYGILNIDAAFEVYSNGAVGLIILKVIVFLVYSAVSLIVSVFYNNDIPNSAIKWSSIPTANRFLNTLNRICIVLVYSIFSTSMTVLVCVHLIFNVIILIIQIKSNIPQSLLIYFILLSQSYSSILFCIFLIFNSSTSFLDYLYLYIPSLLLATISIMIKLNSFVKLLNNMIPNLRKNKNRDITRTFWSIRYLLSKIMNLDKCSSNDFKHIYSFLSNHTAYCSYNSCPCIELNEVMFTNGVGIKKEENSSLINIIKESRLSKQFTNNRSRNNLQFEGIKRKENIPLIKLYFAKMIIDLIQQFRCKEKNKAELYLEKAYIFYVFYNNPYLAMHYIVKGRMITKSFLTSFKFFVLYYFIQHDIEKENQIEEAKNRRNSLKLAEFNIYFHSFVIDLIKGSKISLKLLDEIMKKNQDIILILELAAKFHIKISKLRKKYEDITKRFGNSMKISLYYSVFLLELLGNSNENDLIINEAKGLFTQINKEFSSGIIEQLFGQYSPTYCMLISLNPSTNGKILECSSDAASIFGFKVDELINNNFNNLMPEILLKNNKKSNESEEPNLEINSEEPKILITIKKNRSIHFIYYYKKNVLSYDVDLNYYLIFSPCRNLNSYFNTSININFKDSIVLLLNHKHQIINFNEKVFELLGFKDKLNGREIPQFKLKLDLYQLFPELKDESNLSHAYKEIGLDTNVNLYSLLSHIAKCLVDHINEEITETYDKNLVCESRIFMKFENFGNPSKPFTIMAIHLNADPTNMLVSSEDDRKEEAEINIIEQKIDHVEVEDLMSSSVSSCSSMSNFSQSIKVKNELLIKIQGKTFFYDSVKKYCFLLFMIYIIQIVAIIISQVLEKRTDEEMDNSIIQITEVTNLLYHTYLSVSYFRILMNIMIEEEPRSSDVFPKRFEFYLSESTSELINLEQSKDILNNLYYVNPSFNSKMAKFSNVQVYEIGQNDNETNPIDIRTKFISLKNLCDNLVDKAINILNIFTVYNRTQPTKLNDSLISDLHKNMFYVNKNAIDSFLVSYNHILSSVIETANETIHSNFIYIIALLIAIFCSILISTITLVPLILLKLKLCSLIISVIVKSQFYSFQPIYEKVHHIIEVLNDSFDQVRLFFSQILSHIPGEAHESLNKNIEDKLLLKNIKDKELLYSKKIKNQLYFKYKFNVLIRASIPLFIFFIIVGTFMILSYQNREKSLITLKITEYSNKIQPYLEILIVVLKNNIAFGKIQIDEETGKDELEEYIDKANMNFEYFSEVLLRNKNYFPQSHDVLIAFEGSSLCDDVKEISDKETCNTIFHHLIKNGLSFCINLINYNIQRNHYLILSKIPKTFNERNMLNSDNNILIPIEIVNNYLKQILHQFEEDLNDERDEFFDYQLNLVNIKLIVFIIISTIVFIFWVFLLLGYVDFQIGSSYALLISLPNDTFAEFYLLFNKEIVNLI